MRLLLDECVTRFVKRDLTEHDMLAVNEARLKGLRNGALLQAATGRFDILITVDENIPYQQTIRSFTIAILIIVAKSNAYVALKPLMPQALEALKQIKPGEVLRVEAT
jgi:hypothetical protein